jgi:hypothetical protein
MSRSVHADLLVIRVFSTGNLPNEFPTRDLPTDLGGSPECPEPLISFPILQSTMLFKYRVLLGLFILVGFSMLVEGFLEVW